MLAGPTKQGLLAVRRVICGVFRALLSCRRRRLKTLDLSADVCLVTGAGQGLGRQFALQLAECGATLVLWDIDGEKVRAVAGEIRESGREAYPYVVDISKEESSRAPDPWVFPWSVPRGGAGAGRGGRRSRAGQQRSFLAYQEFRQWRSTKSVVDHFTLEDGKKKVSCLTPEEVTQPS